MVYGFTINAQYILEIVENRIIASITVGLIGLNLIVKSDWICRLDHNFIIISLIISAKTALSYYFLNVSFSPR